MWTDILVIVNIVVGLASVGISLYKYFKYKEFNAIRNAEHSTELRIRAELTRPPVKVKRVYPAMVQYDYGNRQLPSSNSSSDHTLNTVGRRTKTISVSPCRYDNSNASSTMSMPEHVDQMPMSSIDLL